MARTDNRLDLDSDLVGYWGFDEALETDSAIDESQYADAHLSVTNGSSVEVGRVGSARRLSLGYGTVASSRLRISGDLTLICWFKLTSVSGTGTQLRTIVSCSGPTTSDHQLYGLYVDVVGRLVYKHTSALGEVVLRTAPGTIKINQFYNVVILRSNGGTNVQILIDNFYVSFSDITVNGTPSSFPIPIPETNFNAVFSVGRSQKETDLAYWDGLVDEISVHSTVRDYKFYLSPVYFGVTLRNSSSRLSSSSTVTAVTSSEMGRGIRWWCYLRDRDLFVVKESPFGQFGPETRLTTSGSNLFTGVKSPELIYDAASDTLYVFFVAGNKIFKLTASSTDDPGTVNMPFTADTGSIIKAVDFSDSARLSEAGGQTPQLANNYSYVNRQPLKLVIDEAAYLGEAGSQQLTQAPRPYSPSIDFLTLPSPYGFGFVIGSNDPKAGGYSAYETTGGAFVELPTPIKLPDGTGRYFSPIPIRRYGRRFIAETVDKAGFKTGMFSDILVDRFNQPTVSPSGRTIGVGTYGSDNTDSVLLGEGGNQKDVIIPEYVYFNRAPVKISKDDASYHGESGGQQATVTRSSLMVTL